MVLPIIIQQAIKRVVPYVSNLLRAQGRVVDYTYTRPFLSRNINPYIRRGVKHGLAGGQIIAGLQELNSVGNFLVPDGTIQPGSKVKTRYVRKARDSTRAVGSKRFYDTDCPTNSRRKRSYRSYSS